MTFVQAHRAIKRGQIAELEKAVGVAIDVNTPNRFGWTLLMLAAIEGNTRIGSLLIKRGAQVTALNNVGESPLSLAAHGGHLPFVKLLKANGASGAVAPHGHDLEEWLRMASGLPEAKIDRIMKTV